MPEQAIDTDTVDPSHLTVVSRPGALVRVNGELYRVKESDHIPDTQYVRLEHTESEDLYRLEMESKEAQPGGVNYPPAEEYMTFLGNAADTGVEWNESSAPDLDSIELVYSHRFHRGEVLKHQSEAGHDRWFVITTTNGAGRYERLRGAILKERMGDMKVVEEDYNESADVWREKLGTGDAELVASLDVSTSNATHVDSENGKVVALRAVTEDGVKLFSVHGGETELVPLDEFLPTLGDRYVPVDEYNDTQQTEEAA